MRAIGVLLMKEEGDRVVYDKRKAAGSLVMKEEGGRTDLDEAAGQRWQQVGGGCGRRKRLQQRLAIGEWYWLKMMTVA